MIYCRKQGTIDEIKFIIKDLLKLVNKLSGPNEQENIDILVSENGKIFHDDFDRSNILNNYLADQSTIDSSNTPPIDPLFHLIIRKQKSS